MGKRTVVATLEGVSWLYDMVERVLKRLEAVATHATETAAEPCSIRWQTAGAGYTHVRPSAMKPNMFAICVGTGSSAAIERSRKEGCTWYTEWLKELPALDDVAGLDGLLSSPAALNPEPRHLVRCAFCTGPI